MFTAKYISKHYPSSISFYFWLIQFIEQQKKKKKKTIAVFRNYNLLGSNIKKGGTKL